MSADLRKAIEPKSDQLNAEDFLTADQVFTITGVRVSGGEQPINISVEGTPKFYRPGKSMARVMAAIWGDDEAAWVGRSMRLYRDPKVRFGGDEVGGIRISEMSHIDKPRTIALTVTRGKRKPYTVHPLSTPLAAAQAAARRGTEAFTAWWNSDEGKAARTEVKPHIDALKALAEGADAKPDDPDVGEAMSLADRLRAAQEDPKE